MKAPSSTPSALLPLAHHPVSQSPSPVQSEESLSGNHLDDEFLTLKQQLSAASPALSTTSTATTLTTSSTSSSNSTSDHLKRKLIITADDSTGMTVAVSTNTTGRSRGRGSSRTRAGSPLPSTRSRRNTSTRTTNTTPITTRRVSQRIVNNNAICTVLPMRRSKRKRDKEQLEEKIFGEDYGVLPSD